MGIDTGDIYRKHGEAVLLLLLFQKLDDRGFGFLGAGPEVRHEQHVRDHAGSFTFGRGAGLGIQRKAPRTANRSGRLADGFEVFAEVAKEFDLLRVRAVMHVLPDLLDPVLHRLVLPEAPNGGPHERGLRGGPVRHGDEEECVRRRDVLDQRIVGSGERGDAAECGCEAPTSVSCEGHGSLL